MGQTNTFVTSLTIQNHSTEMFELSEQELEKVVGGIELSPEGLCDCFRDAEGVCIAPGGASDLKFVNTVLLPSSLSTKWLTKGPPSGWDPERDRTIAMVSRRIC